MGKGIKAEGTIQVAEQPGISKERQLAEVALDPLAGGAAIASSFAKGLFGSIDSGQAYEVLQDCAKAVRSKGLASVEDMLTAQAAALNAIFLELTRRSGANIGEYMQAAETYMRLALKAQSQCRATLETLAAIKNPPVVYARQANIAAGPQQVNNGVTTARASKPESAPNELLEGEHECERLESGEASATICGDPAMDTVGALDRAAHAARQGVRQSQRLQGRQTAGAQGRAGAAPRADARN